MDDIPSSSAPMSTTNSTITITCKSCDYTAYQVHGSRRTICPSCGSFYDPSAMQSLVSRTRNDQSSLGARHFSKECRNECDEKLPRLKDMDKEKGGNRLQSIANFFQNFPPTRRSKKGHSSTDIPCSLTNEGRGIMELPQIDQKSSLNIGKSPILSGTSLKQQPASSISPSMAVVKVRFTLPHQLKSSMETATASSNWKEVQEFYLTTFDSFTELNSVFKEDSRKDYKTTDHPCLHWELIDEVYKQITEVPHELQKLILKAIINSLLKDKRPHTKDDLRAYVILLQNPQFENIGAYVIFAHLLRHIAALSDHDHHVLVHWIKTFHTSRFSILVQRLHNFISCRLFPPKPKELPPMSKCTWWIPSATKVMALLNASNSLAGAEKVVYTDFYNSTLDHLDLMAEYFAWQNPTTHPGFTFCQYPFMLSITAKRSILQRDSEQQMIIMARRSLVAKVQRRQLPDMGMLFLNLTVRRSHLVNDSLNEIARKQHDLKKKLKVSFAGEPGLDMGGLTKEWFLLLVRRIFQPEYGMFTHDSKSRLYWFSTGVCENYQEFNLVGVLMGLAVYNSIILDIRFPHCCYKKLLSPAVVPYNNPRATVGVANIGLDELEQVMPDLAHGYRELLKYEGDVAADFGMVFQISISELGSIKTQTLKPDGENIVVTNDNRLEYVQLAVEWILNKSIYSQFQAFYHGFHSVCASNALIMLRPEEVETLVCGCPNLNLDDLRKVTIYDGYSASDLTIKLFWEVSLSLPIELQKRLLLFATGSDRVPVGGMAEMHLKITRVEKTDMLPMAHTCFNQLILPAYKTKNVLKQKLVIAIENAEGFGME